MSKIKQGAQRIFETLKAKKGQKCVIITDESTEWMQSTLVKNMPSGISATFFRMEEFGDRPDSPSNSNPALSFPDKIAKAMKGADFSIYAASCKLDEDKTFRFPMIEVAKEHNLRHGHMPGITKEIMSIALCADPKEIQSLTSLLHKVIKRQTTAHLTTKNGTDIVFDFNKSWKWIEDVGNIIPGTFDNIPFGELFTTPANANGTIVLNNGFLGSSWDRRIKTPITIVVKDGAVDSIDTDDKKLLAELISGLETNKNAKRIGEFAIRTNIEALKNGSGLLMMEKQGPGFHLAFEHGFQHETDADSKCFESAFHVNLVFDRPTLTVGTGGNKFHILIDGLFNDDVIAPK